jgi:hypothetical protein
MANRRKDFSIRAGLLTLAVAGAVAVVIGVLNRSTAVDRFAVSGTVTLDGRSIQHAVVMFIPASNATGQRKSGAEIVAGRYEIAESDGLAPGNYRVEIMPYVGPQLTQSQAAAQTPAIPPRYNRKSELTATVHDRGHQTINFPLSSRP